MQQPAASASSVDAVPASAAAAGSPRTQSDMMFFLPALVGPLGKQADDDDGIDPCACGGACGVIAGSGVGSTPIKFSPSFLRRSRLVLLGLL